MPNTSAGSVQVIDTTGTILDAGMVSICAIKYIGASSGTAVVRSGGSDGVIIWEASGTTVLPADDVDMRVPNLHVTVSAGVKVYIYTDPNC